MAAELGSRDIFLVRRTTQMPPNNGMSLLDHEQCRNQGLTVNSSMTLQPFEQEARKNRDHHVQNVSRNKAEIDDGDPIRSAIPEQSLKQRSHVFTRSPSTDSIQPIIIHCDSETLHERCNPPDGIRTSFSRHQREKLEKQVGLERSRTVDRETIAEKLREPDLCDAVREQRLQQLALLHRHSIDGERPPVLTSATPGFENRRQCRKKIRHHPRGFSLH